MKYFGTDGIRGRVDDFTDELLTVIAEGIAAMGCKRVIFGRDTRSSGPRMERIMSEVLAECGTEVLSAGMIPTPVLSYLTAYYGCDCGIMLSASHNPPEYNGVKLFGRNGEKLSDADELAVEEYIDGGVRLARAEKRAAISQINGERAYIDYLFGKIKPELAGMKVALDTANGATTLIAPAIFAEAGAEVTAFNTETDGRNINRGCGATNPTALLEIMAGGDYDIGFTFDGDGDRVMCAVDGKILNGDHIMYVHCKELKKRGLLAGDVLVGTIMSNLGTERACERAGIRLVRTGVGDKNVSREMKKHGYCVGGEESGHIIFSEFMPTGDGITAALLTAKLNLTVPIGESDDIEECPSVSDCIICGREEAERFRADEEIRNYLSSINKEYRIVVRPSGTEPKIRILVEAEDEERARRKCAEIKKFIEERI